MKLNHPGAARTGVGEVLDAGVVPVADARVGGKALVRAGEVIDICIAVRLRPARRQPGDAVVAACAGNENCTGLAQIVGQL